MKIAIVHELLTMKGGAERVLRVIAEMFPDAPIYTLLYDERALGDWFPPSRVRTSNIQRRGDLRYSPFSILHSQFNHHLHLRRFPAAVEAWDFSEFDLVLSSSSAFTHGIITNSAPKHLCYVHSPARYLWDRTHDVLDRAGTGLLGPLKRMYLSRLFHRLRIWDSEAADRPDGLIAASKEVQRRIELYWRRESDVIHPPIDDFWFEPSTVASCELRVAGTRNPKPETRNYYLIVSQLAPYKKIDLAIHACNKRKARLIIAGKGPARRSLESIAGPTVEFVGYRTDEELKDLYTGARATLFPGEEDFGLVPLESLACGTPVIAYRAGGALETLTHDVAEFFDNPTPESLADAMGKFEKSGLNSEKCRKRSQDFSRTRFVDGMHAAIDRVMREPLHLAFPDQPPTLGA